MEKQEDYNIKMKPGAVSGPHTESYWAGMVKALYRDSGVNQLVVEPSVCQSYSIFWENQKGKGG